ncbi:unnamed protein product, partial [Candidula unifasciata]
QNKYIAVHTLASFNQTGDEACYTRLGCFSTGPPFSSPQRPISVPPLSQEALRTNYILYTRERRPEPQTLDARFPENICNVWPSFSSRPTKFIIHGFVESVRTVSWIIEMAEEFLKKADFNVIIVDWALGNKPPVFQAVANTRVVGAQVALLVNYLISTNLTTADDIHIIGQSLGAHIAGYAGERVPGMGRISALDAAGPYFTDTPPPVRLDRTDAKFVDAIHVDAEPNSLIALGTPTPIGHADFFPNGGYDQPGCGEVRLSDLLENPLLEGLGEVLICSHLRAIKYYNESINTQCEFVAFPCASKELFEAGLCQSCGVEGCSRMGFPADQFKPPQGQNGTYFLRTASEPPFC